MERKYKILILVIIILALVLSLVDALTNRSTLKEGEQGGRGPTPTTMRVSPPVTGTVPSGPTSPISPPPPTGGKTALPQALIAKLPYATGDYSIEYFPDTHQLSVTVYSADSSVTEKEVYDWLSKQGVADPMSLDILWSRNRRFVR